MYNIQLTTDEHSSVPGSVNSKQDLPGAGDKNATWKLINALALEFVAKFGGEIVHNEDNTEIAIYIDETIAAKYKLFEVALQTIEIEVGPTKKLRIMLFESGVQIESKTRYEVVRLNTSREVMKEKLAELALALE